MTSANGMQNQLMLSRISRGVCVSAGRHRPRPAPIGQRQATSAKACMINRGVWASGKRRRQTACNINQDLYASTSDINRG